MKMRITHKLLLLGLLFAVPALYMGMEFQQRTIAHTVEREFIDLNDEAQKRSIDLLQEILKFREQTLHLAADVVTADDSSTITEFTRAIDWNEETSAEQSPEERFSRFGQLALVSLAETPDRIQVSQLAAPTNWPGQNSASVWQPVARYSDLSQPFCREALKLSSRFEMVTSDLLHLRGSDGSPHVFGQWVLCRLSEKQSSNKDNQFIAAFLDLTATCQRFSDSPRHLSFLLNGRVDKTLLEKPKNERQLKIAAADFVLKPDTFSARDEQHPMSWFDGASQRGAGVILAGMDKLLYPQPDESDADRKSIVRGGCDIECDRLNVPPYYRQSHRVELTAPQADTVNGLIEEFRAKELAQYAAVSRVNNYSGKIQRIRIRAGSADGISKLADALSEKIQAKVGVDVSWEPAVECSSYKVHFGRIQFDPDDRERYIAQVQAVSREEIEAELTAETSGIRYGAALVFLGLTGLVVFFASRMTRGITKISKTAERFAALDLESNAWQADVRQLKQQLPVDRQDELGTLARTFNGMLAEINSAHDELKNERNQLDEKVERRTQELRKLTERLRGARDDALRERDAIQAFLAQMNHELRTPLNAIIGYSEFLLEEAEDEGHDDYVDPLNNVLVAGRHLLSVINDILDISKILAGEMVLSNETIDVTGMLSEIESTIRHLPKQNNNTFLLSVPEGIGTIYADAQRVRQVLLNLLSNACKFTKNGEVSLTARRTTVDDAPYIEFVIRDTGIGMTAEQVERVFEPFKQADNSTTREFGGTGLGLAISRRFCRMMGGDLPAESTPGEGSVFIARIPVAPVGSVQQVQPEEVGDAVEALSHTGEIDGDSLVLVIDDDPSVGDLVARNLKDICQVETAMDGKTGLELARTLNPTLITLDAMLPEMDGWTVLSRLKSDPLLRDIPVVMLTIIDDRDMGFALGATDYLTKPIDRQRLRDVVARFLHASSSKTVLIVDDDGPTRELLKKQLGDGDWQLAEAENGRVALEKIAEEVPGLVVLDLMMPEVDGFQFLDELRRSRGFDIPVVVVTAKDLTGEDRERLSVGVSQILQKGQYSRNDLVNEIRRLLLQRAGSNTTQALQDKDE